MFIAARHESRTGSPTHALIREVIEGFAPNCVITEGLETDKGPSPEGLLRDAKRRKARGDCPEPLYAAVLAADRGIVFIGGEPPSSTTTEALRGQGSDTDVLGFLVVRHLGQVRRQEPRAELDAKLRAHVAEDERTFFS